MPRRHMRRRRVRPLTRRLQPWQHWSTPAPSAGRRCRTPRLSSSTLRANTQSPPCPPSWLTSRHRGLLTPMDPKLDTRWPRFERWNTEDRRTSMTNTGFFSIGQYTGQHVWAGGREGGRDVCLCA